MVRELVESVRGASAAVFGFLPPWLTAIYMVAASVCIASLAIFLCGRSSHNGDDDRISKKKATAAKAAKAAKAPKAPKVSMPATSGNTAMLYGPMFLTGALASTSSDACGGGGGDQGSCCGGGGGDQGSCCGGGAGGGGCGGGGGGCGGGGGGCGGGGGGGC